VCLLHKLGLDDLLDVRGEACGKMGCELRGKETQERERRAKESAKDVPSTERLDSTPVRAGPGSERIHEG
jgi:hypothetical protein